eukprot:NODE_3210_length_927_cov_123.557500_g3189_i0.p1 GENE.NODE_3210_length_927_cov_123.557500_g3189_i0~~NODE_3210_length_927_cov_123.557500_g3189_i0.p1  ORF type:complete len:246 (+),score=41.48 NODE_3210_length_927_cov_123.557500_g3189_i0:64-801(+)
MVLGKQLSRPTFEKAKQKAKLSSTKKSRERKESLVENVRKFVDDYRSCFVFTFKNFRTTSMKQLRAAWAEDSRFLMGNNKVLALALGRDAESSYRPNLYKLAPYLTGHCGLLFTNRPKSEVKKALAAFEVEDFARAGDPAAMEFTIPKGMLDQERFPGSMEPYLRGLGLPTKLTRGVVEVLEEVTVCQEGEPLSSEAATILKLHGMKTVGFKLTLMAHFAEDVTRKIKTQDVTPEDDFSMKMQTD